jgi:hypothetical protein
MCDYGVEVPTVLQRQAMQSADVRLGYGVTVAAIEGALDVRGALDGRRVALKTQLWRRRCVGHLVSDKHLASHLANGEMDGHGNAR